MNVIVVGSTTCIDATSWAIPEAATVAFARRSTLNLMASAVSGSPLPNLMLLGIVNVHCVKSALGVRDFATCGTNFPVSGS